MEDVHVRWLDEVAAQPVKWVPGLEGYVPRGVLTLLAGKRDVGKSQAAAWLVGQAAQAGGYAWMNSKEDDLHTVVRPRFDALGLDADARRRIAVSEENFDLPADLLRFEAAALHTAGERADLVVIDSLQGHVHGYESTGTLLEVVDRLRRLARLAEMGILIVSHMIKSNATSPELAIAGPGGLQNQAKSIYILGPQPQSEEERLLTLLGAEERDKPSMVVLACERIGIGPKPPSLAFAKQVRWHDDTNRGEPYLRLEGESGATAGQVYAAVKASEREPTLDETQQAKLAAVMIRVLKAHKDNDGWMSTGEFNAALAIEGFKTGGGTYSRARESAKVQSKKEGEYWWVKNGWTGLPLPE